MSPFLGRRRGFTLIEVLVAIAIISVLTAIVLPAVTKARESGKRAACALHLREVGNAAFFYLQSEKFFPPLNNDPADGHWQYNYLIWDGRDHEQNFGPFVQKNLVPDIRMLYCNTQESPYHQLNTFVNPWPVQQLLDTRAAYGRRPRLTGLDVTRLPVGTAMYADLFHTPQYLQTAHKQGINVVFTDTHTRFVPNFTLLTHNNMMLPTSLIDNPTMLEIWKRLDTMQ